MIHESIHSLTAMMLGACSPVLQEAFQWIRDEAATAPPGIKELREQAMYVNVHGYATLPREQCLWESHRHTMDVQYCISGGELIEWTPSVAMKKFGEYNRVKDTQKWQDGPSRCAQLRMFAGAFALFFPNELHRPKIQDGSQPEVQKLVVKIDMQLL